MDLASLVFACFLQSSVHAENPFVDDVRLHPNSFSANHRLGEFYLKQNTISSAIPYLEKAHELDPTNYINSYDLANAYLQVKSVEKSRVLVEQMIKHDDKAELHNLLGDVEEANGHIAEAAKEFELAARMDPTEKHLFDLGSDLLNHRGFQPALTVFEFSVQRYPESARLRVGLGVSYYSLGQYDKAVEALCQAVDLDPQDTKALDFLGKMYDVSAQYADDVTKHLAIFVHNYPNNASAQFYYGLSLRKRALTQSAANYRIAEGYLLRAVQLKPDFTDAHYELGVLYQDLQEDTKAIRQLEIAATLCPDMVKAHYRLGQLYKKNGRTDLARKEFSRIDALKADSVQRQ
jgi:tetratricopeptide (TPR) repeat protein